LQSGEVVMVDPLVQQGLEKDLGCQHLLPDRGQVVDPNRATWRRLPGNPVIAVSLQCETAVPGAVALRAIGYDQFAGWQSGRLIERIKEGLTRNLPAGSFLLLEQAESESAAKRKLFPGDGLQALTALIGGAGHACHYG